MGGNYIIYNVYSIMYSSDRCYTTLYQDGVTPQNSKRGAMANLIRQPPWTLTGKGKSGPRSSSDAWLKLFHKC